MRVGQETLSIYIHRVLLLSINTLAVWPRREIENLNFLYQSKASTQPSP